ncbi:MAG: hypothetical protein IPI67_18960 [Myxococcales bacterium]|nr:hypothetical protein [Myxococcales bacterium]
MSDTKPREPRAERLGRRIALVIFGVIVCGITLNLTSQIIYQTFFPVGTAQSGSCHAGVLGLIAGIRRARTAADEETGGERAAVNRFRAALRPEWDTREALGNACRGDARGERALREVDRLRYAEEHATRYEAVDLAHRRRTVVALARELGGP